MFTVAPFPFHFGAGQPLLPRRLRPLYRSSLLRDVSDVIAAIGRAWTAGQRVNLTNSPSSFIWRLQTADYYAKLPINFDGWAPNDPNNADGNEFCLLLWEHRNYFWIDAICEYGHKSVCEIDISWNVQVATSNSPNYSPGFSTALSKWIETQKL